MKLNKNIILMIFIYFAFLKVGYTAESLGYSEYRFSCRILDHYRYGENADSKDKFGASLEDLRSKKYTLNFKFKGNDRGDWVLQTDTNRWYVKRNKTIIANEETTRGKLIDYENEGDNIRSGTSLRIFPNSMSFKSLSRFTPRSLELKIENNRGYGYYMEGGFPTFSGTYIYSLECDIPNNKWMSVIDSMWNN
ncbi:hypothetical protein [Pseudoalteromonas 'SMAR']|uniref:hypothetical protein n=1 Tax=Pseudoalteromonas 'SMAR' TaxID=3416908 RepID=UPI003AF30D53